MALVSTIEEAIMSISTLFLFIHCFKSWELKRHAKNAVIVLVCYSGGRKASIKKPSWTASTQVPPPPPYLFFSLSKQNLILTYYMEMQK